MIKSSSVIKHSSEVNKISTKPKHLTSNHSDIKNIEIEKASDNRNTNIQLANISMSIMEDLKSLSKEWVEIIEKKHDFINKDLHNFLKFSAEHKKKLDLLKTNNEDRLRKITTLKNIKEQFNLDL